MIIMVLITYIIYFYVFINFGVLCYPSSPDIEHLKWEFRKLDRAWIEQLTNGNKTLCLNGLDRFHQQELEPMSADVLSRLNTSKLRDTLLANISYKLIWGGYSSFIQRIQKLSGEDRELEKEYLTEQIVQRSVPMKQSMEIIYKQLLLNIHRNRHQLQETDEWCISETTQIDYNYNQTDAKMLLIYEFIAVTELKQKIFEHLVKLLHPTALGLNHKKRILPIADAFLNILKKLKIFAHPHNDIRRCDPTRTRFTLGKNYFRFTKLLQGFIWPFGSHKSDEYANQCSAHKFNCLKTTPTLKACQSPFKHKRFDFIEQNNGTLLGRRQYCSKIIETRSSEVEICLCDQTGADSDRYISLIPVRSNISENKVITGVKFVKPYRILQLQIQQGQLLPNGNINQSTVEWVAADPFNITDVGVLNKKQFFLLTNLTRTIAIDELETDKQNHAITSIGFTMFNDVIHITIKLNMFDMDTGYLNSSQQEVIMNKTQNRPYINLSEADIPTYTDRPSKLMSFEPMLLNFTNTGFEQDAAQTTIPYMDAQEVTSNPAVPLIGAGIYYKGRPGYGGFIAPVIKTMKKFVYK